MKDWIENIVEFYKSAGALCIEALIVITSPVWVLPYMIWTGNRTGVERRCKVMTKIYCASIDCKFNKNNVCKANSINLSDGHIHTVHQGYKHIHECNTYEESLENKEIRQKCQEFLEGKGVRNNGR